MRYLRVEAYLAELEHNSLGNKAEHIIDTTAFAKQNEMEGKQIRVFVLISLVTVMSSNMDSIMSCWLS